MFSSILCGYWRERNDTVHFKMRSCGSHLVFYFSNFSKLAKMSGRKQWKTKTFPLQFPDVMNVPFQLVSLTLQLELVSKRFWSLSVLRAQTEKSTWKIYCVLVCRVTTCPGLLSFTTRRFISGSICASEIAKPGFTSNQNIAGQFIIWNR